MSSTISSTLSAGAQLLANEKLLLPGTSQPDISTGGTADHGVQKTAAVSPLQTSSVISGSITSPDGDTVELSAEAMQMLQQMGENGGFSAPASLSTHSFSAAAAYEGIDFFG